MRWLVLLPPLLFHFYLGLALRALARRTGAGPAAWAWPPLLNLVLLLRIAGRSPAWVIGFLLPGVNVVVWTLAWCEVAVRTAQPAWLGLAAALPGPNLLAIGRIAHLRGLAIGLSAVALTASLPAVWAAHDSRLRARVAACANQLGSPAAGVRRDAAEALGGMGALARPALPALERATLDPDPAVRGRAARALALVAPERATGSAEARVAALLEAARGSAGWPLPDAALVSALAGVGADAVPHLTSALRDADAGIRWHAGGAFVRLGRRGAAAAPALLEAMRDPDWNVRNSAGRALEDVAGPEHAPMLSAAIVEPNVEIRYHVARALARLGPRGADAVPGLIETLADEDWEVRMESCWALAAIGPPASGAQGPLRRALEDRDSQVRAAAAWGLAHIGAGPEAIEPVRRLLGDPDRDVRDAATAALRRLETGR